MLIDEFDFDLPKERIAQVPVSPRDSARLLSVDEKLQDHQVSDLPKLLRPGDLLVTNNTRVIPARLFAKRHNKLGTTATVAITLHQDRGEGLWRVFAKPGRKLKIGDRVEFSDDFKAEILARESDGQILLRFDKSGEALAEAISRHGIMPLPPYIERPKAGQSEDRDNYQTVFARTSGAVAAPTAGLHFTPDLLARLEASGIGRTEVTLHVGGGTFLPVKTQRVEDHAMHSEWGEITPESADKINRTRAAGGRIVAVGTTSLRIMESALKNGRVQPFRGETDIFITPEQSISSCDILLTNFHLPRSTLFILVCAFSGISRMKAAYEHAKMSGYRFFSYGDACLLTRKDLIAEKDRTTT